MIDANATLLAEICAKRVELIKEAIPALTRVAVIVNPANFSHPIVLEAMQRTAGALGVELVPVEVKTRDDIAAAIAGVAARPASALVTVEDPLVISNAGQIAGFALQNRLPLIGFQPQAEASVLMEYGPDFLDLFYRSATLVDKILKGTGEFAHRARREIRPRSEPEDRQDTRRHRPADTNRQRRRGDRVAIPIAALHESAFGPKRTSPSALHIFAYDPKRTLATHSAR
jgi:hypothetical protein